jgi:hypothetical protein
MGGGTDGLNDGVGHFVANDRFDAQLREEAHDIFSAPR